MEPLWDVVVAEPVDQAIASAKKLLQLLGIPEISVLTGMDSGTS